MRVGSIICFSSLTRFFDIVLVSFSYILTWWFACATNEPHCLNLQEFSEKISESLAEDFLRSYPGGEVLGFLAQGLWKSNLEVIRNVFYRAKGHGIRD